MLDKNIASTLTPLTEKEQEVQEEIERSFFQPPQRHSEGAEPASYWRMMREQGLLQPKMIKMLVRHYNSLLFTSSVFVVKLVIKVRFKSKYMYISATWTR